MIRKLLFLIILGTTLAACQSTTEPMQVSRNSAAIADGRYVGVFMPLQSPAVDRIAAGKLANEYFMPLWRAYERGQVEGASDTVTVYLYRNGERVWERTGHFTGFKKFYVQGGLIDSQTSLCVETPWDYIAHQKLAPNPGIMCADKVWRYMSSGKGRTAEDAYGVVAIKPRG